MNIVERLKDSLDYEYNLSYSERKQLLEEIDRLNNIITGYNLILRDINNECFEKKMETGDVGYYDIMEKIDKLIGE